MVVNGLSNREIAQTLTLSRKTVEVHRAKVMQKMQADTLASRYPVAAYSHGDGDRHHQDFR